MSSSRYTYGPGNYGRCEKNFDNEDLDTGYDFITTYYFDEENGKIEKLSTVPSKLARGRDDLVCQSNSTATFPSPLFSRDFEIALAAIGALEEKINALPQAKKR